MKVRFWGTRGSAPVSGPGFVEFGGNTPCLQIELASSPDVVIFDSGTGIRELGNALLARPAAARPRLHLFLTHAHWDHIQGFPFFTPAYVAGFSLDIYCSKDARRFLARQMSPPFFPVGIDVMQATMRFHRLTPDRTVRIGDASLRWIPLPHPQESTGLRIDEGGGSLVFATDTEHPQSGLNRQLVDFARDATALVYDAQYTPEEYGSGKEGWGHSTYEQGVSIAREAGVKRLILFSHDPAHDDAACRRIEDQARSAFGETWSARQGAVIDLTG